ncbi:MAG: ubiquinone biosynthesis regulatory protein kinase UbiB [Gammaproteobacteria bacterium]|nr:ubiquinone biosynthesis regulatory protein kinase UbiB [Gammaproteobacteria bacterium]
MRALRRLVKVIWTVSRYRLDTLLDGDGDTASPLPPRYRALLRAAPSRLIPIGNRSRGARLRLALEHLGPVFIKFGQLMSTRRDLIPLDIADELARLQDHVPPFAGADARRLVERAIGQPIEASFGYFELDPIASASVAQVHAAALHDGTQVVVKVVRPGIEAVIREDIELLRMLAEFLEEHSREARRLHLCDVVNDYEHTILDELDLQQEAANTARLRTNFADSPLLYAPRVYWDLTRRNVLVLERIHGIPIGDIEALKARGTDLKKLADRGVETFFTQVFEHNFFHADMHPGNIFVDVRDPANPSYIAIDCAIIGSLTREDQDYLARNLLAFFNRDYAEVARLHLESGWVPDETDPHEFERVIKELCEPIFAKPLNEISFGLFLVQLFDTAREFNMEIQPQLVLLQKTLLYIEGLGRELYPELDLWETAKPFMERWVAQHVGPAAALREFAEHAPAILEQLPRLPALIARTGTQLRQLERAMERHNTSLRSVEKRLDKLDRRWRGRRLSGAALILAATVLLWAPIRDSLQSGHELSTLAGLASAALGSLLLLRP